VGVRVLQILHTDERGGILTLASMIEEGLVAQGFHVDTAILFSSPELGPLAKLRAAAAMALRLARDDHDAIIAYQATASVLTGLAGRIAGCRRRIVHQTALPHATAWPVRLADRLVGATGGYTTNIANTRFTLGEFRDYPASYKKRMVLIEHGLDPLVPRSSRAETRARFGLPAAAPVLLNVSRLMEQKNQAILIDALAQVEDAVLAIAGHGPYEAMLRSRADALGVSGRLHLLGPLALQDVADLYGAADAFVFPTNWETFGLVAVEAGLAGLPMVVADIAVLREVLSSAPSPVRFVARDDTAGWVEAIRAALDAPPAPETRAAFAGALAARYSRAGMVERFVALLR